MNMNTILHTKILNMIDKAYKNLSESNADINVKLIAEQVKLDMIWEINTRFRKTMGMASWLSTSNGPINMKIQFSEQLFERANEQAKFECVTHELAHLVANKIYKDKGHGYWFKYIDRLFGGTGERCHTISTLGLKNRIKRYEVLDIRNDKKYIISLRNYNRIKHIQHYVVLSSYELDENRIPCNKIIHSLQVCAAKSNT